MARTPFKLKSGNATSFKNMGSSPTKFIGELLKFENSVVGRLLGMGKKKKEKERVLADPKKKDGKPAVNISAMGEAGAAGKPQPDAV